MPQVIMPSQNTTNLLVNALTACAKQTRGACAKIAQEALAAYNKEQAEQREPDHAKYRTAAEALTEEGHIEVDHNALVSKGDDEGAYVAAWLWVPDEK